MSKRIYCTYLVTYTGDKLPQKSKNRNEKPYLYLGSSTVSKIHSGYRGSVSSKLFAEIWKLELREHPECFDVQIISYHDTRQEATMKELQLQMMFNVVKNPLFVNMSYATVNGYFWYGYIRCKQRLLWQRLSEEGDHLP